MKENENVQLKKPTEYKGFRIAVSIIAVILVIVIGAISALGIFNGVLNSVSENKANKIMSSLLLKAIPEKIENEESDYVFYSERNENFNPETDNPADFVSFYYFDEANKKIYLEDGIYIDKNGEECAVAMGFMIQALSEVNQIKSKIQSVLVVFAFALLVNIGWISYYVYCYFEDKKELGLVKTKVKSTKKNDNKNK